MQTTSQPLGALLKSARDMMRNDKGLNGDPARLPMLTSMVFPKLLDDLEIQREDGAKLAGKKFRPAGEPPYRWRGWAAKWDGFTGGGLLDLNNNGEASVPAPGRGPPGKGAGPFRYVRPSPVRKAVAEQRRIVAVLDARQAEVGDLKRLQTETAAELDALLPAILDAALRGEL